MKSSPATTTTTTTSPSEVGRSNRFKSQTLSRPYDKKPFPSESKPQWPKRRQPQVVNVEKENNQTDENKEQQEEQEEEEPVDIFSRTSLSLSGNPFPAVSGLIERLSQFRNLSRLDLSLMKSSQQNPNGLDNLDWISSCCIKSRVTKRNNHNGSFGDHLTWLNLSHNSNLTWKGCTALESFSNLCVLNLSHCHLTNLPSSIHQLKNLKALVLNNNHLSSLSTTSTTTTSTTSTATSSSSFPHLPQLNTLILSHNQLSTLPSSFPASLPCLKKLSLSHNDLQNGSETLPDFSLCLALREVRLNGNKQLKTIPNHVDKWGKGADAKTAPGLELFDLSDCGIESWKDLATLLPSSRASSDDDPSTLKKNKKGIVNLSLRGNPFIQSDDGYKQKILQALPTVKVLDNERLVAKSSFKDKDESEEKTKESKAKMTSQVNPKESKTKTTSHANTKESKTKTKREKEKGKQRQEEKRDDGYAQRRAERVMVDAIAEEEEEEEDDDDDDGDEEAAQMAAEMRRARRGITTTTSVTEKPSHPRAGTTPRTNQTGLKQQQQPHDKSKTKNKKQDQQTGFFEKINDQEEKTRLAPILQEREARAKIEKDRKLISLGVLEDVEKDDHTNNSNGQGDTKRKRSKRAKKTKLDMKESDETENQSGKKKAITADTTTTTTLTTKSSHAQQKLEQETKTTCSSVAAIVDLKRKEKRKRSKNDEQQATKKAKILPFTAAANTKDNEVIGSGGWGDSSAWN